MNDLKVKNKTLKCLEENVGEYLFYIKIESDFLNITKKVQTFFFTAFINLTDVISLSDPCLYIIPSPASVGVIVNMLNYHSHDYVTLYAKRSIWTGLI